MDMQDHSGKDFKINIPVKILVFVLYIFCLFLICIYAFKRPYYNWDMLAYMGVVIYHDHDNARLIHDQVYAMAREKIPAKEYALLTDSTIVYRSWLEKNPSAFFNQLPLYVVKPLYTKSIRFLYKSGISLIHAVILLSLIPYLFIGILLFIWMQKYLSFLAAFFASLLLMYSAPMIDVARTSSPDCLSAFFLVSAFYLLIEKELLTAGIVLLLLSVFTRLDNIIPGLVILTMLLFTNRPKIKISFARYSLALLVFISSYLVIAKNASSFGWNAFYYPSFLKQLNLTYFYQPTFHFMDYFALAYSHLITGLLTSNLFIFLLLLVLIFFTTPSARFPNSDFDQKLCLSIFVIIIIRFILQPSIADRFYIPYYLITVILLVSKLTELSNRHFIKK